MEITVGVDVDDVRLSIRGQTQIHPAVVAAIQGGKGCQRDLDDALFRLAVERAKRRRAVDALGGFQIPFGAIGDDLRPIGEGLAELDFGQRKRLARTVSQKGNVDLPTFDVPFDQRRLAKNTEHLRSRAPKTCPVGHHRIEVHSHRSVFPHRFDDQWEGERDRLDVLDPANHRELRGRHRSGSKQFLGLILVQRQAEREPGRSGVGQPEQLEQAGDGHFSAAVARERLAQIDDQDGLSADEGLGEGEVFALHRDGLGTRPVAGERVTERRRNPGHVFSRLAPWIIRQEVVVAVVQDGYVHEARREFLSQFSSNVTESCWGSSHWTRRPEQE